MKIKLALFFLLIPTLSFSQLQTGVLAGGNMMIQDISPGKSDAYLPAFHIGVLCSLPVAERLSMQAGLNYQLKGYKQEIVTSILFVRISYLADIKYHYLELPLNLFYTFNMKTFNLMPYAGMYAALAVSGTRPVKDASGDVTIESINFEKDVRRTDYGCQFGVGFEFEKFFLRVQYSLGLGDINRMAGASTTNNGFGLSAGVWIPSLKK